MRNDYRSDFAIEENRISARQWASSYISDPFGLALRARSPNWPPRFTAVSGMESTPYCCFSKVFMKRQPIALSFPGPDRARSVTHRIKPGAAQPHCGALWCPRPLRRSSHVECVEGAFSGNLERWLFSPEDRMSSLQKTPLKCDRFC